MWGRKYIAESLIACCTRADEDTFLLLFPHVDLAVDMTRSQHNRLLCVAAEKGCDLVVGIVLAQGDQVDPAADDNFPIRAASLMGHASIVASLLATGRVDPCSRQGWCFRWARSNGHIEVLSLLLSEAAYPYTREYLAQPLVQIWLSSAPMVGDKNLIAKKSSNAHLASTLLPPSYLSSSIRTPWVSINQVDVFSDYGPSCRSI